jgi:FlaA1/EpsC-like NDP-sugar epimerase
VRNGPTAFITVRFGNVLASNGSVVPRFMEQIRAGGPVTVTDPEVQRYFMLIPEAVHLVLHAAAHGQPGATYVLDMGDQIKIVDLARNLIRLSGFVPDQDVAIEFTGLRPGEKLREELVGPEEVSLPSAVEKILRVVSQARHDRSTLLRDVHELEDVARSGESTAALQALRALVPGFGEMAVVVSVSPMHEECSSLSM